MTSKSRKNFGVDLLGAYSTEEATSGPDSDIKDIDNKYNNEVKQINDIKRNNDIIDKRGGIDNKQPLRKRGRPKVTDRETRSKNFNLLMPPSLYAELIVLAGERQAERKTRLSVTDLINEVLADYVQTWKAKAER